MPKYYDTGKVIETEGPRKGERIITMRPDVFLAEERDHETFGEVQVYVVLLHDEALDQVRQIVREEIRAALKPS